MLARPTLTRPVQDDASKPKPQARPTEERFLLRVDGQIKRSFSSKEDAATAGAVCSLVLCFGGSAGAQERGKTLYAAQCERCHKSPQDVTTFHGGVGLETFLGEHADTPESAASMAAYLKGLAQARPDEAAKKRPTHSRRTKQRGEANPFQPAPSQPVPNNADPNDDPVKRALKRLFGGANP